jgi:hypothetical protein
MVLMSNHPLAAAMQQSRDAAGANPKNQHQSINTKACLASTAACPIKNDQPITKGCYIFVPCAIFVTPFLRLASFSIN